MSTNPIKTTSRSFLEIMNDINSDPDLIDKPEFFKRMVSGVGDVIATIQDLNANQSYIRTAFTFQSVKDLLKLIDYEIRPRRTSQGTLTFYLSPETVFPITVEKKDLIGVSPGGVNFSSLRFEAREDVVVEESVESFMADVSTNSLTVGEDYVTGGLVRVSTTNLLPTPLETGTDYYAIKVSETEIKLASNKKNAFLGLPIAIEDEGSGTHYIKKLYFSTTAYQQTAPDSFSSLGQSDGISKWQTFNISEIGLLEESVSIVINDELWVRVDTLLNSASTDKHYRLLYNSDESGYILFGDGNYGKIPEAFDIIPEYASGGGLLSNVNALDKINSYGGGNEYVKGVTNTDYFSGGDDRESIDSAKIIGPMLTKKQERFVTKDDGLVLIQAFGGISTSRIDENYYGLLSCRVTCVPNGGGALSSALKTELKNYLTDKTILSSVDVRVTDANYAPVDFTSSYKVESGYTFSDLNPMYELGVRLILSERTAEIKSYYSQNGIEDTVSLLNSIWETTFGKSNYSQIASLIAYVEAPSLGVSLQESKVISTLAIIKGIDHINVSVPWIFPVNFSSNSISTIGTIVTTEIL